MVTFKQLEALYWIAQLGSFEAAAAKLNMSQSAISKRIVELEDTFSVAMFDRTRRTARLTTKGFLLLEHATELLYRRDQMLGEISDKTALVGRYRIGVTELTAMTWLPSLVEAVNEVYPRLQLEPIVEVGTELFRKFEQDHLDLVVLPDVFTDSRSIAIALQPVNIVWMCAPRLLDTERVWKLHELSSQKLLTQGTSSGSGLLYQRWFAQENVNFPRSATVSNLLAQVGLTLSGMGISYLPKDCLQHLLERGDLGEIKCDPPLPPLNFVALYRPGRWVGVSQDIGAMAQRLSDFSKLLIAG
ncbi:LysR family transcriptional regulator [Pseudomonas sp. 7P_10.2_Bac1]|uniref:LysR family transcriptional regulator n=1 Tax=Pseudomonas sp. 7P_10.2_Bac1 TaxID=2971614 RepID=UPI0021CA11E7|nr:LysR family transcriptional regulator [Pseudomonas sp. 7P_10.2_Bac1]MCU1726021.1 LysR family transcriptional regulator [Pseudomonas sp. 7P_10.2_Bac1]